MDATIKMEQKDGMAIFYFNDATIPVSVDDLRRFLIFMSLYKGEVGYSTKFGILEVERSISHYQNIISVLSDAKELIIEYQKELEGLKYSTNG